MGNPSINTAHHEMHNFELEVEDGHLLVTGPLEKMLHYVLMHICGHTNKCRQILWLVMYMGSEEYFLTVADSWCDLLYMQLHTTMTLYFTVQ